MASTTIGVGYRPLRIGFCVNPNNIDEIREVIRLNTMLWGGIYNPIIPVDSDLEFSKQLTNLFQVDLLYPLNRTKQLTDFIKDNKHLPWLHYQREIYQQDGQGLKPAIFDVSNLINYYWDKEFKTIKKSNCVLPKWNKSDKLDSVFAINFGQYPDNKNLLFNFEQGFSKGLRAKSLKINMNDNISSNLIGLFTPIKLTDSLLELSGNGWSWTDHGVYIGQHDNSIDLINFWNLRASAMDVYFLPIKYSKRMDAFIQKHVDRVSKRSIAQKFQTGVAFWYRSDLDENMVKKISDKYVKQGIPKVHHRLSNHSWNGLNIKPFMAHFESKNVLANIDKPYNRLTITLQHPGNEFEMNGYNNHQSLVVTYNPPTLHEYPEYTLSLPYLPDINEWYGRNITFDPFEFRVGKGEFGKIIKLYEDTASLRPIKNNELIKKIFGRVDIKANESQSGLITKRLIEQMGGVDSRVFKIPGVRKLIEFLNISDSITYSTAVQKIRDYSEITKTASFDKHKGLYIEARDKKDLTPPDVFDHLLDKNILRIGLEPVCPNCKLPFWMPIKDVIEEVKCEYCGYLFKIGLQLRHRGDWRYRRSGLFGKNNNQEGAIPVILSLMHFLRRGGWDGFIYSTALNLINKQSDLNCEIDLAFLNSTNEGIELLIGECKNKQEITDQDIKNLLKVKQLIDSTGIKTYLLFSKLIPFTDNEIKRFQNIQSNNSELILLTNEDLEPYEPYFEYTNKGIKLPDLYTSTLDGMARNSKFLYLDKK